MKTDIRFIDCRPSEALKAHVKEKLNRLESDFEMIESGKVTFKVGKNDELKDKCTEIEIKIPKKIIFAESKTEKFVKSCDEALEKIRKQLEKIKTKANP